MVAFGFDINVPDSIQYCYYEQRNFAGRSHIKDAGIVCKDLLFIITQLYDLIAVLRVTQVTTWDEMQSKPGPCNALGTETPLTVSDTVIFGRSRLASDDKKNGSTVMYVSCRDGGSASAIGIVNAEKASVVFADGTIERQVRHQQC